MAIGARTDNSSDLMKKLLGEISNVMVTPDAPVDFLGQLHSAIVGKLREPVDMGYASGQLGSGQPQPGMAPGMAPGMGQGLPSNIGGTGLPAMIPGPSSAGGMSPLAALLGGAPHPGSRPSAPSADELRRVLRKIG